MGYTLRWPSIPVHVDEPDGLSDDLMGLDANGVNTPPMSGTATRPS
jgi:hypothetical protein